MGAAAPTARARKPRFRRARYFVPLLLLALGAGAGAAWALLIERDDAEGGAGVPREVSVQELRSVARKSRQPVYWAGSRPGTKLELTETSRGAVYVRYLTEGAPLGDRRPSFTTVATYPTPNAYAVARRAARRRGARSGTAPGGHTAVWNRRTPGSVYLAAPGSDVLVEVYEPDARRARSLALSGEVGPVR